MSDEEGATFISPQKKNPQGKVSGNNFVVIFFI